MVNQSENFKRINGMDRKLKDSIAKMRKVS